MPGSAVGCNGCAVPREYPVSTPCVPRAYPVSTPLRQCCSVQRLRGRLLLCVLLRSAPSMSESRRFACSRGARRRRVAGDDHRTSTEWSARGGAAARMRTVMCARHARTTASARASYSRPQAALLLHTPRVCAAAARDGVDREGLAGSAPSTPSTPRVPLKVPRSEYPVSTRT
jgi:hypothetical protein